MNDGVPLPEALSGNMIERLIVIDEALLYLVNGTLAWLADREKFEETGALTVDDARLALSDMLTIYFSEVPAMIPVGSTMIWHMDTPPDKWLICDGSGVLKSAYPKLFALFGTKYGGSVDFFGLPDLTGRSPFGATFAHPLDSQAGSETHTLTVPEIPAHTHALTSPFTSIIAARPGGSAAGAAGSTLAGGAALQNTGGGGAHNNLHPVMAVNFIVYAGE